MGKKILVVVDMQNDFIDGVLGTKEAVAIVPNVVEMIKGFDGDIFFTQDTHYDDYLETQEGKNLPVVHCINGTEGWKINKDVLNAVAGKSDGFDTYPKITFGSVDLADDLSYINETDGIDEITFIGVCTGICVISNAMMTKAFLPEVPIKVVANCCACVTPESHKTALEAMKMCQIEIV